MADKLTRKELAREYGFALEVIYSVPELATLFERAVNAKKGQFTVAKFQAELQDTNWYKNNPDFYRTAWAAEKIGGADWQASLNEAKSVVQSVAVNMGADVTPEELSALARRYIYEGWGQQDRQMFLAQALSEEISYMPSDAGDTLRGKAGTFTDNLKSQAMANGLRFNDNWYLSAAKSVASGLTTESDWERDIQKQAASMFPTYAEQINAGMTAMDIASPYISIYAQTMEANPYEINLSNPDIRRGLMDGMGLFEFEQMLRQKPEWINTKQAEDQVSDISLRVMRMFGLVG